MTKEILFLRGVLVINKYCQTQTALTPTEEGILKIVTFVPC